MGIPILHTIQGESAEIVKSTGAGIVIEPESPAEIARELIKLYQSPKALNSLSQNGQRAAAGFDRKNLAHDMLNAFETAIRTQTWDITENNIWKVTLYDEKAKGIVCKR